jgi:acyl-CoA reductase-like NAD-dependent aldehyde dehydrogenase
MERAGRAAKRIRSGNVHINGAQVDFGGCFGGFKQSGNGREWGEAGLGRNPRIESDSGLCAREIRTTGKEYANALLTDT